MAKTTDSTFTNSLVYYGPGDVRIEPMEKPEVSNGDVLIEVEACAICGTDVKSYHKGNPRIQTPMIMGHEFCGTIIEAGKSVQRYTPGQRVTMATTIGCGSCFYCKQGKTNLCTKAEAMGFQYPGAMAPYILIPAKAINQGHLVEVNDLEADIAALAEPVSCVVNNFCHVPINQINSILIIGLGPLGIMHVLVAQSKGIHNIYGVDVMEKRRKIADSFGLKAVLTPEQIDNDCKNLSSGVGFDLVVITAPNPAALAGATFYARKGGYVSLFGSLPKGEEFISVNSRTIHYNELYLYGTSDSAVEHVVKAVEILRNNQQGFRQIVTHHLTISDFHSAIDEISCGNALKVILKPN